MEDLEYPEELRTEYIKLLFNFTVNRDNFFPTLRETIMWVFYLRNRHLPCFRFLNEAEDTISLKKDRKLNKRRRYKK